MSRLSIELKPDQHKKIKSMADRSGSSIKKFVLDKVFADDKKQNSGNHSHVQTKFSYNKKELAALYAKNIDEDRQLAEEGIGDYKTGLLNEDIK